MTLPTVNVIKRMKKYDCLCFDFLGFSPEEGAFRLFNEWLTENHLHLNKSKLRVFGYNHPSPSHDSNFYGYRVCVTINNQIKDLVKDRHIVHLQGGMYATMLVKSEAGQDMGKAIMISWQAFSKWLESSPYQASKRQWLEEHKGFNDDNHHIGDVILMLGIELKPVSSL